MEIGRWGRRTFTVSSSLIRGFTGLTIKGSSETEDKKDNKQKYVARKNGNPAEISMTVQLHASLGVKVRGEALAFVSDAQAGKEDYFYLGGNKLVTYKLMLTDAAVEETQINAAGEWVSCKVKLTFKQCSKLDGTSGGSSSGSGSGSGNKSSTKVQQTATTEKGLKDVLNWVNSLGSNSDVDTVTMAQPGKSSSTLALNSAITSALNTISNAKKETAQKTTFTFAPAKTSTNTSASKTSTTTTTKKATTTAAAKKTTTTTKKTTFTFAKAK